MNANHSIVCIIAVMAALGPAIAAAEPLQKDSAAMTNALIEEMKQYFDDNQGLIEHTLAVYEYAEQIRRVEGGDLLTVRAAAIYHDIGIPEARRVHGSSAGQYQETEGPPIARKILARLTFDKEKGDHVCRIVANHHTAHDEPTVATVEFKIIWDADALVNLRRKRANTSAEEFRKIVEKTFRTREGLRIAEEVYLADSTGDGSGLGLTATGHDSRIDLKWSGGDSGYHVYRSEKAEGPFEKLTEEPWKLAVYSDFLGENGLVRYYRVTSLDASGQESQPSKIVRARSYAMTDEQLLTSVQEATFRYFWDFGHPVSGLSRERLRSRDTCTSGGTGFGMMAIVVGVERGFVERSEAAERLLKMVRFLQSRASRYHGAWSHWINGRTGKTIPFSKYDDGGDLVETSYLVEGMLTVRQYFDGGDATERQLREIITTLWKEVEWDWYLREEGGKRLYWHWSPRNEWRMNHGIGGHFNECMITYLLAIASPSHAIDPSCYYEGWVGNPDKYANGNSYYGHKQWVGWPMGGPLFFTHYTFLGFDPRGKRDRFCNYFQNNRNISLIHRAYCAENPGGHKGYSESCWGLTASDTPGGYTAHQPGRRDNGTITPTAAISAMPYVPKESIVALKHFYHTYGEKLWGPFGFKDAFNLDEDWVARGYLAIDQGPIVVMIENYRSELCWRLFMANPEIGEMLEKIGWKPEADAIGEDAL